MKSKNSFISLALFLAVILVGIYYFKKPKDPSQLKIENGTVKLNITPFFESARKMYKTDDIDHRLWRTAIYLYLKKLNLKELNQIANERLQFQLEVTLPKGKPPLKGVFDISKIELISLWTTSKNLNSKSDVEGFRALTTPNIMVYVPLRKIKDFPLKDLPD